MTNTRITDPEILEARYPLRLWEFSIRRGSGGAGLHRGGDGIVREIEFLRPLTVSMLTSRRHPPGPFGLHGGTHGLCGSQHHGSPIDTNTPTDAPKHYRWETLPSSCRLEVRAGDRLRIETPGGGGYGMIDTKDCDQDSQ
jgi:5-oxoprolinase (ATP-hydrolysing)